MIHVIDGNNLAGKLKILSQKNFDKSLVIRLKDYYQRKKINVYLVFDGRDSLGDRSEQGYLTIIFSPQDRYYESADDKIVEIVGNLSASTKDDITLITSDRELISRAQNKAKRQGKKLILTSSDKFAEKLIQEPIAAKNSKDELDSSAVEKINQELLDLWTK
jgi:predicted RNA-binding protein with PIN domain